MYLLVVVNDAIDGLSDEKNNVPTLSKAVGLSIRFVDFTTTTLEV